MFTYQLIYSKNKLDTESMNFIKKAPYKNN